MGIARKLAKAGSNIVLNGFGEANSIQETIKSISDEYRVKVSYSPADLRFEKEIEGMMKEFHGEGNASIDILVNNAGIQHVAPIDTFPVEKWNEVMAINLSAVFHTTRLALPSMKKKNWGRIINIASVHGLVG